MGFFAVNNCISVLFQYYVFARLQLYLQPIDKALRMAESTVYKSGKVRACPGAYIIGLETPYPGSRIEWSVPLSGMLQACKLVFFTNR
jgi:hypothetical protein